MAVISAQTPADQGPVHAAEDRVGLGRAVPHRQVPINPRVRLGRAPVEGDQPPERAVQVLGVEPVEGHGGDRGLGQHLPRQPEQQRRVRGVLEDVRDRQVADRGGDEHRPVGLLGPEVAEYVPGHLGVRDVGGQGPDPLGDGAVDLPDEERRPVPAPHDPGLEHVGAEVDQRLDHPLRADSSGERTSVQAVLQRDHERAFAQAPSQERCRGRGVLRLDRDQDRPVQLRWQVAGRHRRHAYREVLHRPLDPQAAFVNRRDHGRICVTGQYLAAVTGQAGGNRAADRTAADHHVPHGAQHYNTVNPSVQLRRSYLQSLVLPATLARTKVCLPARAA